MKKQFVSIVCLMCVAMVVAAVAKAQDSDIKKHEEQWEQLNAEVLNALQTGRYEDGIPLGEKTYQYALKNLGKTHTNTLISMNNLAGLYKSQGRYKEAEPLFNEALHMSEKILGKEHPDILIYINNLASLYESQGRYEEAEPLFKKALQLSERILGKEHPYTLLSINYLASLYKSQGRYREAEALYNEALRLSEKVLGKEHLDTLLYLNNFAGLYELQGRYEEAEPLLKKVLQLRRKVLGKEHPETLITVNNLARLYQSQGRYGEAELLFNEALQLNKKVLGKGHPSTLAFLNNIAFLYRQQGRYGEAESLYKEALQLREKLLGKEHPDTLISANNISRLYEEQGRYGEAESLFKETLQFREKVLGKEHPDTLASLGNLAGLYTTLGRYGEAEPWYKEVLQRQEKILGKDHPHTLISASSLAGFYKLQGRYKEAEPLFKEVLQRQEKVLGKEHPDTLVSLGSLAGFYESQERYKEAEPLYKEALQRQEKVLGKDHPDTLRMQFNYIVFMIKTKEVASAFCLLKNMENHFLSRSFQELYTTSQNRIRRLYLLKLSNLQSVPFSFALKYPETEYQQFAANVILQWKQVYSEENIFQHRILNISHDSDVEKLKNDLIRLRTEFSQLINHNTGKRDASEIWSDLQSAEYVLREKTRVLKTELQVSSANIGQLIGYLPPNSGLIEFRLYLQADFKTGKPGKPHLVAYLLLPNAKLSLEDIGEAEDILSVFNSKESNNILYQKLFAKFDKHIKNLKTLYIAPDGFLNLIPFAALKLPDGRYFAERQQINQLQTGRDLLASSSQKPSDVLIAVGGIDFGKSPDRKLSDKKGSAKNPDDIPKLNMRSGEELEGGFKALPDSTKEAAYIANLYRDFNPSGKTILLNINDGRTTEGYLKQIVQSPRILHLSTHGFYLESKSKEQWGEEEPLLLSGLALANANLGLAGMTDDKGDDGLLHAIEVAGLNLQGTELVSLSACDTGKGVVDYSEGVYGLVRAFRTAGAQNVLMTLSPVGDSDSKEFMIKFYEFLLSSNLTPADAMHRTRLHFIRENRKPEFWSPYVLVGK